MELIKEFKEGFKRGYSNNTGTLQQRAPLEETIVTIGGEYGGSPLQWTPYKEGNRKIALVGSREKRLGILQSMERQILKSPEVRLFKINYPKSSNFEQRGTLSNIVPFEQQTPVDQIPNETLAGHRQSFVNLYIKLISTYLGINGNEWEVQPNPSEEGPLMWYFRASERFSEEMQHRVIDYLEALDHINWGVKNNLFELETHSGFLEENYLEFVKGIWSFWVFSMITSSDEHRVVCIEVPTYLQDEEKISEISMILRIIEEIADLSKLTVIFTSETTDSIAPLSCRVLNV